MISLPLMLGYGLDLLLGDPRWMPHPIVGFGRLIHTFDTRLNRGRGRFWKGLASALALILGVFFLFAAAGRLAAAIHPAVGLAFEVSGIFFALANQTLVREGRAVFAALRLSLEAGRRRLSWIVGRDTADLSVQEVKTAVFETMAENLSDGVVAPLFWYALLGLPGMMAYKMVNTLDSMIGHKDERYYWFGKTAARIDDAANLLPARLTAALMALVSLSPRSFRFIARYGSAHDSPNSGYPEAALAGILDLRFGGPHTYDGERVDKPWIGANPREIGDEEIGYVAAINHAVCFVAVVLAISGRTLLHAL